jgi:Kelch motif
MKNRSIGVGLLAILISIAAIVCEPRLVAANGGRPTVISGSGTVLDGQVLIEGGFFNLHAENTAEIYDPVGKTFTPTANMNFSHGEANAAVIP